MWPVSDRHGWSVLCRVMFGTSFPSLGSADYRGHGVENQVPARNEHTGECHTGPSCGLSAKL